MAISWYEITSYCKLGIDWFTSSSATGVSITPRVYRYDLYNTDNYGGTYDEYLSPDPTGSGAWYNLTFGSGSGTRTIDTFATRSYTRTHSSQTVTLKLAWENLGSYYSDFKNLGSGSNTWTLSIDPLASYTVSYNANGGSGAPSSQTKWYGEELTLSSTTPTRTGYAFQGWATTSNATSAAYAAGGKYTANSGATLYAVWKVVTPAAPTDCTNTRNSDTKNTVAWTRGTNADTTYSSVLIERSTDGGSWSQIASVSGTATSYADTTTSADHYYRYRVRAYNTTDYSSYATSDYTYNTPAAPTRVRAYRTDATTVKIEVTNAARTATALEVQRSSDESTWATVATVSGTPVTETTDTPSGGTFYYRARNTRGSLASDWSPVSNGVVTIVAPAAPTLVSPASGIVVSKAQEAVTFEWLHNPFDGSAQTAAELRYSTDGGSTWTTVAVDGNTASYALSNAFAVNSSVTWGVRTKGAHKDFGPWSGNRTFNVYQQPSVAFAQPTDGFVVENTPIAVELQYDDPSGELASASLAISDGSKVVWSRTVTGLSYEIASDEWAPDNEATYYATVEVRSSSSLTASASRKFTTAFVPPIPARVDVEYDVETGLASLSTYLRYPLNVSWNGDPTGFITAYHVISDMWYCKVSDYAPSAEEVIGGKIDLVLLENQLSFSISALDIESMADGFLLNVSSLADTIKGEFAVSVTGDSMTFSPHGSSTLTLSHGLWFTYSTMFSRYISSLAGPSGEQTSITWDGDTTGLVEFLPDSQAYKVSDLFVSSAGDLVGQTVTFISTSEDYSSITATLTADNIIDMAEEGFPALVPTILVGTGEELNALVVYSAFSLEGISVAAGTYFPKVDDIGYISELTLPGTAAAPEEPKFISVYREVNGERVLLGDGLQPGAGLVDKYAPVNVDYDYVAVAIADSGAVSTSYLPARFDSQWFYFIFGDNVAKGRINPEGSKKLTRPNRRRQHFAGRQSPVSFDDGSVSDTRSVSVLLRTKEEADAFEQMMWDSGRCVYKSGDGDVIHADVELSDRPAWTSPTYYGSVSVSITRIDGEAL